MGAGAGAGGVAGAAGRGAALTGGGEAGVAGRATGRAVGRLTGEGVTPTALVADPGTAVEAERPAGEPSSTLRIDSPVAEFSGAAAMVAVLAVVGSCAGLAAAAGRGAAEARLAGVTLGASTVAVERASGLRSSSW